MTDFTTNMYAGLPAESSPIMPVNLANQANTIANTANTNANTQQIIPAQAANIAATTANTQATTQGTQIDNQIKQQQIQNLGAYSKVIAGANSGTLPGHPNLANGQGTTQANPAPTGTPNAAYTAAPTNSDGTPYTVDSANNVYLDKDGSPVTSLLYRPDGSMNKQSAAYANYVGDGLLSSGATPQFAESTRKTLMDNAQEYDKNISVIHQQSADIKQKQSEVQSKLTEIGNDSAYRILSSGDNAAAGAAYITTMDQNPGLAKMYSDPSGKLLPFAQALPKLQAAAQASGSYNKSLDAKKTQQETKTSAQSAATSAQEASTSATNQRQTEQNITQSAATNAITKTKEAGAAASQQSIVGPALDAIDRVGGNQTLIKGGLNNFSRQVLGSEPAEVKTDSLLELPSAIAAPIHAGLQKIAGSATQPGTDAYKLKNQIAPVQAALSEAITVAEKEAGATSPKNAAYLDQMKSLVGRLDVTKQNDPEDFNRALAQAKGVLQTFSQSQGNVLDTLNKNNPFGVEQKVVQPSSANTGVNTKRPTVGEIRNGHVFKGGDPNVQSNWQ